MKPSNAMIPGEILCSLIGLVLAYFGGIQEGWLNNELVKRHGDTVWLVCLGLPALLTFAGAMRGWLLAGVWRTEDVNRNARWRARTVLLQGLCWLYAVYFGFDGGPPLIGSVGAVCFVFCAWSYHENRRTCREIRYATAAA